MTRKNKKEKYTSIHLIAEEVDTKVILCFSLPPFVFVTFLLFKIDARLLIPWFLFVGVAILSINY